MQRRIFPTLIFLALFSCVSAAYGQWHLTFQEEQNRIIETTWIKMGPLRVFPVFRFTEVGYDNNVFRQVEILEPATDFTLTFSPEIRFSILLKENIILRFIENPAYVHYFDLKELRGFYNSYTAEFKWRMLLGFVLSGKYTDRTGRYRPWGEFTERVDETRRGYDASLYLEGPQNTFLGISAGIQKVRYPDIADPDQVSLYARILNRTEKTVGMEFNYQILSDTAWFVQGSYTEYTFEFEETAFRDSYSYQVSSGLRFPIAGDLNGLLSVGYKYLMPRTADAQSFSALIGSTSMEYRRGRFRFRAQYVRDTPFSLYSNSIYYVADTYGGGISFYLLTFLRLDYNYSLGEGRYPDRFFVQQPNGSIEEIKRNDTYRIHTAGIVFRLSADIGIEFNVNFWERESNVDFFRRSTFIGAAITYDF